MIQVLKGHHTVPLGVWFHIFQRFTVSSSTTLLTVGNHSEQHNITSHKPCILTLNLGSYRTPYHVPWKWGITNSKRFTRKGWRRGVYDTWWNKPFYLSQLSLWISSVQTVKPEFMLLEIASMFKISATLMVVNVTKISNDNHCIFFLGRSII